MTAWAKLLVASIPLAIGMMVRSDEGDESSDAPKPRPGSWPRPGSVPAVSNEGGIGDDWPFPFSELPEGRTAGGLDLRDAAIADWIMAGDADESLQDLAVAQWEDEGLRLRCLVMRDAVKVNGIRCSLSYARAAQVAAAKGMWVPTPYAVAKLLRPNVLGDAYWSFEPQPQNAWVQDGTMAHTTRMIEYSWLLDGLLDQAGIVGEYLVNVGKWWCIDRQQIYKPDKAINFGWFQDPTATPSGFPIQPPAAAHWWRHVDYSQVGRWFVDAAELDAGEGWQPVTLSEIVKVTGAAKLLTGGGPLPWGTPQELVEHERSKA